MPAYTNAGKKKIAFFTGDGFLNAERIFPVIIILKGPYDWCNERFFMIKSFVSMLLLKIRIVQRPQKSDVNMRYIVLIFGHGR